MAQAFVLHCAVRFCTSHRLLSVMPATMQNSLLVGCMVLAVTLLFLTIMLENNWMIMFCFHAESEPADHFGVLACALAVIVLAGSQVVMNFQRPMYGSSRPGPPSSSPEAMPAPPEATYTSFFRTRKTGMTLHLRNCNYVANLDDDLRVEMRPCGRCGSLYGRDGEKLVRSPTEEWHKLNCTSLLSGGRRRHILKREYITPCKECKPLLGQRGVTTTGA